MLPDDIERIPYFNHLDPTDKSLFKSSKCVLVISVGQHYHEDKRLEATLKLINANFKSCLVLVADALQRHSIAVLNPDKPEKELYDMSIQAGTAWIERNAKFFQANLEIPYTTLRWDHWLNHPEFQYHYEKMCRLYKENNEYKKLADEVVELFLFRVKNRIEHVDIARVRELSLRYILEECAVVYLWSEIGSKFMVYPAAKNKAMDYVRNQLATQTHQTVFKHLAVVFNKIAYKSERAYG